eukprot:1330589-Amorphochlora_amoeboformis.AAC.1
MVTTSRSMRIPLLAGAVALVLLVVFTTRSPPNYQPLGNELKHRLGTSEITVKMRGLVSQGVLLDLLGAGSVQSEGCLRMALLGNQW